MNGLMISLIATVLAATGGPWWQLARRMAGERSSRERQWLAAALLVMIVAGALMAAGAAHWVAIGLAPRARLLFLAIALLLSGIGMIWVRRRRSALAERLAASPAGAYLLLTMLLAGDSALFLILAVTAWTGSGWTSALGGIMGLLASAWLALADDIGEAAQNGLAVVRIGAGIILIGIGLILALRALMLV